MAIHHIEGDLLQMPVQYICHQVNCQGVMGAGIAKQIKNKWPRNFLQYKKWGNHFGWGKPLLGKVLAVKVEDNKYILNLAAQENYGREEKVYTSYAAFQNCLDIIKQNIPEHSSIGFPCYIGCGLAGGNWDRIRTLITGTLAAEYEVYICRKPEEIS